MLRLRLIFVVFLLAAAALFARAAVATETSIETSIASPAAATVSAAVLAEVLTEVTQPAVTDDRDWPFSKIWPDWQLLELSADPEEIARPAALDTRRAGPAREWRTPELPPSPPPPRRPLLRPPAV